MRFVVTGTGRSGTGFAAALFNNAGVPCGHESVFGPERGLRDPCIGRMPRRPLRRAGVHLRRLSAEWRVRRTELEGDASWMAVPRLSRFRGAVFLQVRDPLEVVSSFQGTRFFMPEQHGQAQTRFAMAFYDPCGDPVVDAMRWWVLWNARAEAHATLTYRLEDLDAALFGQILELAGVTATRSAPQALELTSRDVNSGASRGHAMPLLTWADLPSGPDKDALAEASARYGYPAP